MCVCVCVCVCMFVCVCVCVCGVHVCDLKYSVLGVVWCMYGTGGQLMLLSDKHLTFEVQPLGYSF